MKSRAVGHICIIVLISSFQFGKIQASAVTQLLTSKLTQYIRQFNPLQSSYLAKLGAKSAENRGDEYGYGHSGGSSVYVHAGGDDYGNSKGYGHGGHQNHHGAITLDPVSIISLLALGAFLINNILQLLRANQASGRSLDVSDLSMPLDLSDMPLDRPSSPLGTEHSRVLHSSEDQDSPSFSKFFANVGSLYYMQPKKRNICIKKVVCNYMNAQQSREESSGNMKSRIFEFMLSTITRFVAPEISDKPTNGLCQKFNKHCSDAILHDAKVAAENKVYSTVTSFVSNFAIQRLMSG